jgi:fructoselysine-6-P-deglycase FrlB-like protein
MLNATNTWIQRTLTSNNKLPEQLKNLTQILLSAKRVFVTGSGSSLPAATILADIIRSGTGISITFVSTSQLLITTLRPEDCVILVSQGCNRSDAKLILNHAQAARCGLGLITAAEIPDIPLLKFYPTSEEEKLFCRPVGVMTSYLQAVMLGAEVVKQKSPTPIFSRPAPQEDIVKAINDAETVVVLSSGLLSASAANVALALREGAGKKSFFFDIENFGHGQYVPFLKENAHTFFLLFSAKEDTFTTQSVKRILPLFQKTSTAHHALEIDTPSVLMAGLSVLFFGGSLIHQLNDITGYDMNNPKGKEENRPFHEVDLTYYE